MVFCKIHWIRGTIPHFPFYFSTKVATASLVAQMGRNLPGMRETCVSSLGRENAPEKGMATHSVFLPGESHGQRSPVAAVHGVTKRRTQLNN